MAETGKLRFDNGCHYAGEIEDGKANGYGTWFNADGTTFTGMWENNVLQGPARVIKGGQQFGLFLPKDVIFKDSEIVSDGLFYDSDNIADNELYDGGFRVYHPGHSAFIIETPSCNLIIDWYQNYVPKLRENVPTFIIFSHIHTDHFNRDLPAAFTSFSNVELIVGIDAGDTATESSLKSMYATLQEVNLHIVVPGKALSFDLQDGVSEIKFRFFHSTDMGVSMIVITDGYRLFHAGDLAIWGANPYILDSIKAQNPDLSEDEIISSLNENARRSLIKYLRDLEEMHFDYAMLPMDMRLLRNQGLQTVKDYIRFCDIDFFTPIHLFNQEMEAAKQIEHTPEVLRKAWGVGIRNGYPADSKLVYSRFVTLPLREHVEKAIDEDNNAARAIEEKLKQSETPVYRPTQNLQTADDWKEDSKKKYIDAILSAPGRHIKKCADKAGCFQLGKADRENLNKLDYSWIVLIHHKLLEAGKMKHPHRNLTENEKAYEKLRR